MKSLLMYMVGAGLIWLAIKKKYEPALLLPMGFGAIMVNLPLSGVLDQEIAGIGQVSGIVEWLYHVGIETAEVFPILLFIGIGAMIDFAPLLARPVLFVYGIAAQLGIAVAIGVSLLLGFDIKDAFSIGIIGAADGPTSILVSNILHSNYTGAIAVAAYSYMALVPIIQPATIKCITTRQERSIKMNYDTKKISKRAKIMFPIIVTIIAGIVTPMSLGIIGFLMFGNLIRECGVLDSLSRAAQNELTNVITLLLGITISFGMRADVFVRTETILVLAIGLIAFVFDTIGGVMLAKFMNLFLRRKINPMIGAAGISAFPMASRVVQRMAMEEDASNVILMQAAGANVAGQIASALAGGILLQIYAMLS